MKMTPPRSEKKTPAKGLLSPHLLVVTAAAAVAFGSTGCSSWGKSWGHPDSHQFVELPSAVYYPEPNYWQDQKAADQDVQTGTPQTHVTRGTSGPAQTEPEVTVTDSDRQVLETLQNSITADADAARKAQEEIDARQRRAAEEAAVADRTLADLRAEEQKAKQAAEDDKALADLSAAAQAAATENPPSEPETAGVTQGSTGPMGNRIHANVQGAPSGLPVAGYPAIAPPARTFPRTRLTALHGGSFASGGFQGGPGGGSGGTPFCGTGARSPGSFGCGLGASGPQGGFGGGFGGMSGSSGGAPRATASQSLTASAGQGNVKPQTAAPASSMGTHGKATAAKRSAGQHASTMKPQSH